MKRASKFVGILRGVAGAVLGGVAGYCLYDWMLSYGFYALILPGTLVGVGFGLFSRRKCVLCGIACGAVGLALGMFAEWRVFAPKNETFLFFVTHLHHLQPVTLLLIGLGGLFSFWFGVGRDAGTGRQAGARTPAQEHPDTAAGDE